MRFKTTGMVLAGILAMSTWALAAPIHLEPPHRHWPQDKSDVAADPSIHFGVLPNGMRYLIRKNDTPTGQVSLRLRIAAGSLYEVPADAGIAHFLEHLAFRGSKHLPDGAALKMLQDLGLSLGADLNAHTSADQTVFEFDLPRGDAHTLSKGLELTREIAGNLTLAKSSIDSERKVVLAEARQRSGPAEDAARAEFGELFGPRLGNAMLAIGTEATIKAATPQSIARFYHTWYRPDRATLIVIGDIDPAMAQAEIEKQFGDWKATGPAPKTPALDLAPATAAREAIVGEAGAPPIASINYVHPYDATPDTLTRERRDITREIGMMVLNQRLASLARSDTPPFLTAAAHWSDIDHIGGIAATDAQYAPGGALAAIEAMHQTLATALAGGVRQDEVDVAVKNMHSFFASRLAAANSTASAGMADEDVHDAGADNVITSPEQDAKEFEKFVPGLTAQSVSAALRQAFTGAPPEVFVSGPTAPKESEATFHAALMAAPPSAAATDAVSVPWPYTDFGPKGTVASRDGDAKLGVTFVTFANGVRATIRPSELEKGQILISVRFGTGRLGMAKTDAKLLWALQPALLLGGLAKITPDQIERALAGHAVNFSLAVEDDAFSLEGATRPEDLTTELQLLAAAMTDPAYRANGFSRGQISAEATLTRARTAPDGVLQTELPRILHDGDPRFGTPTTQMIADTTLDEVKAFLKAPLQASPIEIVIVGDLDTDKTIDALASTFGAMPQRPAPLPVAGDEHLPAAPTQPIMLHHDGPKDQAVAALAWPGTGIYPDPQEARTLRVLATVLSTRLFDEVRTAQGLTYTPQATSLSSLDTPGYGYVMAFADVPPDRVQDFLATAQKTAAALAARPVSETELKRARDPMINDLKDVRQTNRYWLSILEGANVERARLELIGNLLPDTEGVTAADVQKAARTYLTKPPITVEVLPSGAAPTEAPAK